jgi:hypothetical protein
MLQLDVQRGFHLPRRPPRILAEGGRSLSRLLPERARKGLRVGKARVESDVGDAGARIERKLHRSPAQPQQLHEPPDTDAGVRGKLPVEVKRRKIGDSAQRGDGQLLVEVLFDVVENPRDAAGVVRAVCFRHRCFQADRSMPGATGGGLTILAHRAR